MVVKIEKAENKPVATAPPVATEPVATSACASSASCSPSNVPLQWDRATSGNCLPASTGCPRDWPAGQAGPGVMDGGDSSLLLPSTTSSSRDARLYPTEEERRPPLQVSYAGAHVFGNRQKRQVSSTYRLRMGSLISWGVIFSVFLDCD